MDQGEGLYYEDLTEGRTFRTERRAVTQADVEAFAEVSGDRNPLHLDESYAGDSVFGRRVAHGVLGLAVATGLLAQRGVTRGTLVALLGVQWEFVAPLFPGAVTELVLEVKERRETSRRDRGVVVFWAELYADGEVVQRGELRELVRRRP